MIDAPISGLSPQQIRQRIGSLTASRMAAATQFLKAKKKDEPPVSSEARERLKRELLAERITDLAMPHYVTPAMQHGIDSEPLAKDAYMLATGNIIEPMPTVPHPTIANFLATPDGRIAPTVGVEIKCPETAKYIGWRLAGVVPDEHKPQMLAQCVCAGFREVEFIAFDPRVPDNLQLFVRRYVPTEAELAAVEAAAIQFLDELEAMFDAFVTAPAVA